MLNPAKSSGLPLRLAVIGMIPGNGHPYSWSAIINGYAPKEMSTCPYPVISKYLGAHPHDSVGIPTARVTHVWTDNPSDAESVARASLIPHIVGAPEDVIGHVDGVLIATDEGHDHVRRVRPFVEAGLPVFVDKPLATTIEDLVTFKAWQQAGAQILSSSGLRYAPELTQLTATISSLGELRWISSVTCKTWERYAIHALEPVSVLLGSGFLSVRLESQPGLEVAHLLHRSGTQVTLPILFDAVPINGTLHACGTAEQTTVRFKDTYHAFRNQLLSFIEYARTNQSPYPFSTTIELMAVLIAGIYSRQQQSRRVDIAEVLSLIP